MNILRCMGSKFCVKFQRAPLKFHTKFWTHTPQNIHFTVFYFCVRVTISLNCDVISLSETGPCPSILCAWWRYSTVFHEWDLNSVAVCSHGGLPFRAEREHKLTTLSLIRTARCRIYKSRLSLLTARSDQWSPGVISYFIIFNVVKYMVWDKTVVSSVFSSVRPQFCTKPSKCY